MCKARLALLPLLLLALPPLAVALRAQDEEPAEDEAPAAAEPDLVVLTSGNRLTGSVTELSRGSLTFSIAGAGSVNIDWRNVDSLKIARDLDVELTSGERLSGSIASTADRKFEVDTDAGPRVVDPKDVVRITPIAESFVERTSGSVELGFNLLKANDEVDLTLDAAAENRTRNYLTKASFTSLLRLRDEGSDQRRGRFDLGSRRFLPHRWYVLGQFELEADTELDLDLRFLLFGALGHTLVQSNRAIFSVHGGLDYNAERYDGIEGTDHTAEALVGAEWEWFGLGADTDLSVNATTYIGLSRSRVRFDLDSSIRHDIVTNYYVSVTFFLVSDSDPPADLEKSDYGLGLTFGRTF